MRYFRVIFNGCFFEVPRGNLHDIFGFYIPITVAAKSAPDAVSLGEGILLRRLKDSCVKSRKVFAFSSFCYVSDIWEIENDAYVEDRDNQFGFVFYRIGVFKKFVLMIRKWYLQVMQKNSFVSYF